MNQALLTAKLNAILSKDVAAITAQHIFIPKLGTDYTEQQLQQWLDKWASWLNNAKPFTDAQLDNAKQQIYNSLSQAGKAIADAIIAGRSYSLDAASENDHDGLILIVLYRLIR